MCIMISHENAVQVIMFHDVSISEMAFVGYFVLFHVSFTVCSNLESIHDLVICRLSRQSGYATGGDEVFLLCEKINKGAYLTFRIHAE